MFARMDRTSASHSTFGTAAQVIAHTIEIAPAAVASSALPILDLSRLTLSGSVPTTGERPDTFDLHHQGVPRPVVLDGLGGMPPAMLDGLRFVRQGKLVIPGQLCKHALHKVPLRLGLDKGAYVIEVAR